MIQIGTQKIKPNIFLAALAGCADLAFRLIAREQGAGFCFSEMSDANSLVYNSRRKSDDIHQSHPDDLPLAAQLMGADPENMFKGALHIIALNEQISFIDINAACPIPKIIKKKAGAYLLKEPEKLFSIIDKLATKLPLPITVKLRTGYMKKDVKRIIKIAQNCEKSGAQAIFVHGRTMKQMYSGDVDHESIKAIKDGVKIPVLASGNIFTPQKAKEMIDLTGCDGVMVARGALGNPWIFNQIKSFLDNGTVLPEPTLEERLVVLRRHIQYIEKYKLLATKVKVGFSRKVAFWYLKNFKYAAVLRARVNGTQSFQEFYTLIDEIEWQRTSRCPTFF